MSLLDVTIVNVALPSIRSGLGTSAGTVQWVVSGYALAFGLTLVAGGRLGDAYGRRRLMLIGLTGFIISSAAVGLAPNVELVTPSVRAVVCLGLFGWDATLRALRATGYTVPRPKPRFGHGAEVVVAPATGHALTVLGCYHPSQQNTFTGKLTEAMLDDVLGRARTLADRAG